MGSREPEAASAVLAGFCRAGERSGVELVARVLVLRLSVPCGGGSHAVRVGSCFGVRPFVAGGAATWLGAVQPECAAFEVDGKDFVRGVTFRVTVRRFYLSIYLLCVCGLK